MYGKVFSSMYDGTLYGHWQAIVCFQQMIVLCDSDGVVDMTPQAMAARTSIPLEIIQDGLKILEQPDPYTRTPGEDGKRITRLDDHRPWGWRIVNHKAYRDMIALEDKRRADRERVAAKRAAEKETSQPVADSRDLSHVSPEVAKVAHADADADAVRILSPPGGDAKRPHESLEFHNQVIAAYHELLPNLAGVKVWSKKRIAALNSRIRERCRDGKPADTIGYWREFFETVSASPHLVGGNDRDWRADLEWLLVEGNFAKVIEGRYAARRQTGVAHAP